MSSTGNNFYKTGNKSKYQLYGFDGYKTGNIVDNARTKNSISPTRLLFKDTNKNSKNSSYLPLMNSYNGQTFKHLDNVIFFI
jgi:hypothetical protein